MEMLLLSQDMAVSLLMVFDVFTIEMLNFTLPMGGGLYLFYNIVCNVTLLQLFEISFEKVIQPCYQGNLIV